jgi:ribosomal protein S18 acetylase RimI-like enzyme
MRDGNGMLADDASGIRSTDDVAQHNVSPSDLDVLRDTILKSVTTSSGAFLATVTELEAEPPEYWENRLRSSTWAVVQRGSQTLGIAAAKPPSEVDDYALQEKACFIESVWIDPSMRGKGFGERLVAYLIEQQRGAVGIQKFYLWVFDYNAPAIRLYKRMGFKPTGQPSDLLDKSEVQFLRAFDSDLIDEDELKQNATDRKKDRKDLGITYRLLSANPARAHLLRLERLSGWQAAGSMSRYLKDVVMESRRGRSAR